MFGSVNSCTSSWTIPSTNLHLKSLSEDKFVDSPFKNISSFSQKKNPTETSAGMFLATKEEYNECTTIEMPKYEQYICQIIKLLECYCLLSYLFKNEYEYDIQIKKIVTRMSQLQNPIYLKLQSKWSEGINRLAWKVLLRIVIEPFLSNPKYPMPDIGRLQDGRFVFEFLSDTATCIVLINIEGYPLTVFYGKDNEGIKREDTQNLGWISKQIEILFVNK